MKKQKSLYCSDEICGKETEDYINEFNPHRLSLILFEEDSEKIFDSDEEKTVIKK